VELGTMTCSSAASSCERGAYVELDTITHSAAVSINSYVLKLCVCISASLYVQMLHIHSLRKGCLRGVGHHHMQRSSQRFLRKVCLRGFVGYITFSAAISA
jgi:hypothetical protein